MRIAPTRRLAHAAVAVIITGSISTVGLASASAAELAPSSCRTIGTATAGRLKTCIAALRKEADTAGRAAQIADEQYLKAKAAATQANADYDRSKAESQAAQITAARSRARAGAVAAHLARSGSTASQTTQVLLSGDGATRVLYSLSRMSELTVDSTRLATDAARDSRAATALEVRTGLAANRAQAQALQARTAFAKAKKESAAAKNLVISAEARQRQLAAASSPGGSASPVQASYSVPADASTAERVLAFARSQIGDPYVFGAAGPSAWDCSGLTMGAFDAAGIGIGGHGATVQYDTARSRGLLVPFSAAQPGDLIFYTDGGGDMYHVTIYSGGGMMLEAPYEGQSVREVPVRGYQLVGDVARFTG